MKNIRKVTLSSGNTKQTAKKIQDKRAENNEKIKNTCKCIQVILKIKTTENIFCDGVTITNLVKIVKTKYQRKQAFQRLSRNNPI